MNQEFAYSISQGDPIAMAAFGTLLDTPEKWKKYLARWYGRPTAPSLALPFSQIGNRDTTEIQLHEAFVALFVAVWISRPLCKAAYTLELTGDQPAQCLTGFQGLYNRKSSHITDGSGSGMSAYRGMQQTIFKGARELLVQGIRYRSFETSTGCFGTSKKKDKMKSSRTAVPERLFLKAEGWNCTWGQIYEHGKQYMKSRSGGHDAYYSPEFGTMYESINNLDNGRVKLNGGWGIHQRETEKKKELEGVKELCGTVKTRVKSLKIKGQNFKLNKSSSTMTMRELIATELFIIWACDHKLKSRIIRRAQLSGVRHLFCENGNAVYNDVFDSSNTIFAQYLSIFIAIGADPWPGATGCEQDIVAARNGLERIKKQVLLDSHSANKVTRRTGLEVAISTDFVEDSLASFQAIMAAKDLIRPLGGRNRMGTMQSTIEIQI